MREGQPEEAMKQNSGYTMLLNEDQAWKRCVRRGAGCWIYREILAARVPPQRRIRRNAEQDAGKGAVPYAQYGRYWSQDHCPLR
ncbi:hypothetical protein DVH05_006389 [Phytophthora capsici]|nr:hypothetical protein DVH05_006389 [Phytophthora capsici]